MRKLNSSNNKSKFRGQKSKKKLPFHVDIFLSAQKQRSIWIFKLKMANIH